MSSQTNEPYTTVAELAVLGPDGVELDRSACQVVYAESEEVLAEDGAADNLLDEMSDTFWHTEWGAAKPGHPHQVVIDLGSEQTVAGVRYLPRQDSANGRIKQCRLYVSPDPFPGLTP
jgi:beta-galactosidase